MHRSACKKFSDDAMWIYGRHSVKAAIRNPKREVLEIVLLNSNIDFLNDIPEQTINGIQLKYVDKYFFDSLFGKDTIHQGCAVLVKRLQKTFLNEVINDTSCESRPLIFLDQVTDPQNIGSILRSAAVFGIQALVMTEKHSPEITPVIAKAASGALEEVPLIRVANLVQSIIFLKKHGYWVIGLDEKSDRKLSDVNLQGKFAFVIGSEGSGMRRLTRESCDFIAKVPGFTEFTTLNAAQAATVVMYETCRQRINK